MIFTQPHILEETDDYAVVFKTAKTHCIPISKNKEETLLDWYAQFSSANIDLKEGGLIHRLDFETHGLVLFAKNLKSFEFFKNLQEKNSFVKEYSAVCTNVASADPFSDSNPISGFPPSPNYPLNYARFPVMIESFFRPFGPGRKEVRPVIEDGKKHHEIAKDKGEMYRTEIIGVNGNVFTVRIKRGFRHQIRCHLCWIGKPILNDPLYGNVPSDKAAALVLRAHALYFTDPSSGVEREYRIEHL